MARNWDAINKYVADDEEMVPAAVPEVAEDVAVPQVDLAAAASREPASDQAESQKIMEAVLPLAFSFFGGESGAISTPKTMTQVQSMQEKVAAREQKNKLANQALLSKQAQMLQAAKDKAEARAISEDHFNRTDQRIIEQGDLNRKASAGRAGETRTYRDEMNDQRREDKKEEKARLSDKQVEAFASLDDAESDLNNLLGGLKKEYIGPIDGRVPDMLSPSDRVAYKSAIGKYKDAYRKASTGAGAGPSEIAILESRLPSAQDTEVNFKAKAQEALKEIARRRDVMSSNLQKNGKNVSQYKNDTVPKSGGFPRIVSNGKNQATVSNEQELQEAMKEGFQ